MNYGELLSKSWNTFWQNKYLILLGMLAAFSQGGGSGGNGGGRGSSSGGDGGGGSYLPDFCERGFGNLTRSIGPEGTAAIAGVLVLIIVLALVFFALWCVGRIAEGGLIDGVSAIDGGQENTFMTAIRAGWSKAGRLIGIGLVTGIPGILLLVILGAIFFQFFAGQGWPVLCSALVSGNEASIGAAMRETGYLWIMVVSVSCVFAIGGAILEALRAFADRACMLEDTGVLASYGRGWEVLSANFGQVFTLFILQLVVGLALAVVLIVPTVIMAACWCLMWPVLWAIRGSIIAYFSTLWTLAWRQWTGKTPGEPVSGTPSPAV